jgi:hypothetical protein
MAMVALFLTQAALAAEDPALAALDACRAKLDARSDVGMERIEKRCPDLMPALLGAPWSNLLPNGMRDRRDEVSAESLRALGELVRSANRAALRPAPGKENLAPVLAELGERGQQGATRWERFKRWLQEKLDRRGDEEDDEQSLLDDIGREFETSEGVARLISYLGYGLMALLVMFIIWVELRAAGLFGGARGLGRVNRATEWRRKLLLADVMAAPLADRPGLLLKLLGEALTRANRLPAADGLSAGAMVRRAQLDSDAERAELAQVAATAEAVRYGPSPPAPERLEGAVGSARALLAKFARLAAIRKDH